MITYARGTLVSPARSREEIERTLARFGARDPLCITWKGKAAVIFEFNGKRVRIDADLPTEVRTPKGRKPLHPEQALDEAQRQIWRAILVSVKGRLTEVEAGIKTFEEAFIGDILLPNGQTVGEFVIPKIEQAYLTGDMPPLLLLPGAGQ